MSFFISEARAEDTSSSTTPSSGGSSSTSTAPSSSGSSSSSGTTGTVATTGSSSSTTPSSSKQAIGMQVVMIVGLLLLMYFLIWRPQAKRAKEHRAMVDNLHVGSEVVFAGGLIGRVKKIEGDYVVIALSPANEVKVQKSAIQAVLPDGTINSI